MENVDKVIETVRILRSEKYNTTQALELIENEFKGDKYIDNLVEFVRSSKRGCTLRDKSAYHGNIEKSDID